MSMFQASLLSEGTPGYGDARSRALSTQVALRTFGYGRNFGAIDPETVSSLAQSGTAIFSTLIGGAIAGGKAKKEAKAAAAASEAAARQAILDEKLAAQQAKSRAADAKIAEAEAASRNRMILVVGGLGLVAMVIGGGLIYTLRAK